MKTKGKWRHGSLYVCKKVSSHLQKMHTDEKFITLFLIIFVKQKPCLYNVQYKLRSTQEFWNFYLLHMLFWMIYTSVQTLISLCLPHRPSMIWNKPFYLSVLTEAVVGWELGPLHEGCVQLLQEKIPAAAWHSPID